MPDFKRIMEIIKFIDQIYEKNSETSNKNTKNYLLCQKFANLTEIIVKLTIFFYGLMAIFTSLFPIIAYFIWGIRITATRNSMPWLDRNRTTRNFIIALVFDSVLMCCAASIVAAIDGLCFLVFTNMAMVAKTVTNYMNDIRSVLLARDRLNLIEIKQAIIALIVMQRNYSK